MLGKILLGKIVLKEKNDNSATYAPVGELVITFDEGQSLKKESAKLAFKFEVIALRPYGTFTIYIDAQNGRTIKKFSTGRHSCSPTIIEATTLYNGQQSFAGCYNGWWSPYKTLKREDNNLNIITRRHAGYVPFNSLDQIFRPEDDWSTLEHQYTSAHWALDKSWTYFRDVRNRNGWDGSGFKAKLRVDGWNALAEGTNTNAGYSPNTKEITIGRDIMALDVLAHEFTHGMTQFTANLGATGSFQSLSLDESFSDIFGEMVENHATGATNLSIGNQVPAVFNVNGVASQVIRNLVNPAASVPFAQPSVYGGDNWAFTPDNRGPHQNGGVQNKWFSLLAQGDLLPGGYVTGIGIDNAARIAWLNLTTRLGEASNYIDARNGALDVSRTIFGECSNEHLQNIRAWGVVGLGVPLPGPELNTSSLLFCLNEFSAFPIELNTCWFPGATFSWDFPAGIDAVANGSQLTIQTITQVGVFPISLTATLEGVTYNKVLYIHVKDCDGNELLKISSSKSPTGGVRIFPNPTSHFVNIELPAIDVESTYNLRVINTLGQVVLTEPISYFNNKVDMSSFAAGFYNFIIQDTDGNIKYTLKIQKSNQ
jgi:Zn-dependent metalloprotease